MVKGFVKCIGTRLPRRLRAKHMWSMSFLVTVNGAEEIVFGYIDRHRKYSVGTE